ncbi:MAG: ACR3 family arsenite efflux transporter [Verrucomicrobia bacterium]|nr:MAG: ACR3 family arsenite efflux transporter [Verrucomicrobiota bacterium]
MKMKVLFLCTGNSCRSQMAEGWARALKGDVLEVYSAGIEKHGLNPRAVRAMAETGVDISAHTSKTVAELGPIHFDYVVTVCGHANEHCPLFPGKAKIVHVGFDDPPQLAKTAKTEEEALAHYRRVRDEIRAFVETLPASLEKKMSDTTTATAPKRLAFFERYLTVWVFLCMVVGVTLGKLFPGATAALSKLEFGHGSQVNVPIGVLLWLMIYPMMLKVDFGAIGGIAKRPKGLMVTLLVNWLIKPFSMALLAWVFMQHVFAPWIAPEIAKSYTAGLIILAAAPCTAMVFVWSYLTDGDPIYTLVQVAVNDLIMLVAFAPLVMFLCGVAHVVVPAKVLITSVIVFIVIPLSAGWLTRTALLKSHGPKWFDQNFLPKFHPVMVGALLLTLILIFAFQAQNLTSRWFAVLLIAVPIVIQVYFNSGLTYLLMRRLRVAHNVAAPGALIGASNFFELAVAVAITLFGADSPAALATVVGVLVEVPVMLSVCKLCNRTQHWYQTD